MKRSTRRLIHNLKSVNRRAHIITPEQRKTRAHNLRHLRGAVNRLLQL